MTVASSALRKFDSANVDNMLEKVGKDVFLKTYFLLAIFGGGHPRSRTAKLATSGQPGAEGAFRHICMTFTEVPGSEVLTDHELLRLSSSAIVLFELVLGHLSLTAVMKSLVQYSENFDSSHNVSFQEARKIDVAKNLVS